MPELRHCGSVAVESEKVLKQDPSCKGTKFKALDLESAKRKKKSGFKSSNVDWSSRHFIVRISRATCPSISSLPHLSGEIAGVVGVRLLFAIGSSPFLHALRVIIISAITATPCGL
jgi:hypothetical protein